VCVCVCVCVTYVMRTTWDPNRRQTQLDQFRLRACTFFISFRTYITRLPASYVIYVRACVHKPTMIIAVRFIQFYVVVGFFYLLLLFVVAASLIYVYLWHVITYVVINARTSILQYTIIYEACAMHRAVSSSCHACAAADIALCINNVGRPPPVMDRFVYIMYIL
jgi:hypothetical protein